LNDEDAIISDSLNHASIIDGIRLCKAVTLRYENNDMDSLERKLKEAKSYRMRLIATDGVFSMDGNIAKLDKITSLAKKYDALLMVDDSHATGFIGETGRGTGEYHQVMDRVDIITSTLGKALGGASGGFTSGKKEIIEILRQRSRPYLFSNTIPPVIISAALKAFDLLSKNTLLRDSLESNTTYFRKEILNLGFKVLGNNHPIVPIMLSDAVLAKKMEEKMLHEGVYVVSFSYPVVPKDMARIRIQISANMTTAHLDKALDAFKRVGRELGVI
jgi:glycine C-acetyltransferase